MNKFVIDKGFFWVFFRNTCLPMWPNEHRDYSHLLEPETVYNSCIAAGKSKEETVDIMLEFCHRGRIFDGDWLGDMSLCIALLGPRGSGKSVGMTGIAVIDGLLAGRRVISNLPIAVQVIYKDCSKVFRTESLDAALMLDENEFNNNYYNCLICVDEVNTYLADSQRSMTNQSLTFSNILQQMRHRKLSFIFTTQAEGWNTNRVRFQTDFYIQCRDNAMFGGRPKKDAIGRHSQWRMHDMSGLQTGEILKADSRTMAVPPFDTKTFWNTPFWDCFDTELMQKREKYNKKQDIETASFDDGDLQQLKDQYETPTNMIRKIINYGFKQLDKAEVWVMMGISGNRSMQTKIGARLTALGCETVAGTNGKAYVFPTKAAMQRNLSKLGLTVNKEGLENG